MKISKILMIGAVALFTATLGSCDNTKSYAELLTEEDQATNAFLVNQRVITEIPENNVFEYGSNAPFYQLDEDGNVFMQVINPGTPGYMAEYDQLIYFRFMRYSMYNYTYTAGQPAKDGYFGTFTDGSGNDSDMASGNASFRFDNLYASNSAQWGSGLQLPLKYLPMDCQVNLVVKSQLGLSSEIAYVTPYFYANLRYFKSQI